MQNLKVSLKLQQEENRRLKEVKESFEAEREKSQRYMNWLLVNLKLQFYENHNRLILKWVCLL